jgi:DNA repair protein RecN (Recombination protein N)
MLTSLVIENFAIVSHLELDFAQGMTAFTGETGAGKSIMIDALTLALGGRADASVIRPGAEKCDIYATFLIDQTSAPAKWLIEHDLSETDEILLRRVIFPEGRSKSYINGQPFPLQKIKELSEMLVDIHGQHQHQSLLQHATHRQQLDQYANHANLLEDVSRSYHQCQQIKQRIDAFQERGFNHEKADLLQYQIEELTQLAPTPGEIKALYEEHRLLHHAREYLEQVQHLTDLLNADEQPNIRRQLNFATQILAALPAEQPQIRSAAELINSAFIQCDEALNEINAFSSQVQLDPERLQIVEERMSDLHKAARKYHVDVNQLAEHAAQLQNELLNLQQEEKAQHELQHQYEAAKQTYHQAALKLHESRQAHASKLADEITVIIRQLGMPKGYVIVEITSLDKMQAHGLDKVEYMVCTNPGMLPDTLGKIVSGGELSRISLGIQMITAQRGATPTLLFDEVDVGIGGATAAIVGQLLRKLGDRLQIFCVTHQAQVAACAHHHFRVEKQVENEQTFSHVYSLSPADKINEIARMLGGLTITDQTRSHAQELLIALELPTSSMASDPMAV